MRRILLCLLVLAASVPGPRAQAPTATPALRSGTIPIITVDGVRFRDLNRNGTLDPYEDWRRTIDARVADLLGRLSLEEKAGTMMHGTAPASAPGIGLGAAYDPAAAERLILGAHVTSLITRLSAAPDVLATQNNALQAIAERGRHGIPLTISTDPRHHFQGIAGAATTAGAFTQWPETLGLAALRDPALVRRFADIARREYRAVGIHMALSPQADLATEPRWPRMTGTFGEDPDLVSSLVGAYVEGFQHGAAGPARDGVACVVKHWVGYGAAPGGYDGHNHYGRFARLDGALEQHIRAFDGALAAKVAGVMPTYTIQQDVLLNGAPIEQVGGGYSRTLLTGLLRGRQRFDGMILSDWGITNDCGPNCREATTPHTFRDIGMPWGVESLTVAQRFAKGIEAGLDQFGGTEATDTLVAAVRSGAVAEARIDESVRRILRQKFQLGLFEHPFVEPAEATRIVGAPDARALADATQRRALVLLERRADTLPLKAGTRVFVHGMDPDRVRAHGLVPATRLEEADVAVLRVGTPFDLEHPRHFFGQRQHEGRLDFREGDEEFKAITAAAARVPTVVFVALDRPAVLTNVRDKAAALFGVFGASDDAVLDVVMGAAKAEGRLPFALPRSMADVNAQSPGKPHDLPSPLYPFGAGK